MKSILYAIFFLLLPNYIYADSAIFFDSLPDAVALSENINKPVLVIFGHQNCLACSTMKIDLDQNPTLLDNLIICYIDMEVNKELAQEYRVRAIPDYFILQNNIEIKRRVGYKNIRSFKKWINDK